MKEPNDTQSASSNDIATSSRSRLRWVVRGIIGIIIFLFALWIIYGVYSSSMQPNNDVPQGRAPADGNLPASLSNQVDDHSKQNNETGTETPKSNTTQNSGSDTETKSDSTPQSERSDINDSASKPSSEMTSPTEGNRVEPNSGD